MKTIGIFGMGRFGSLWAQMISECTSSDYRIIAANRTTFKAPNKHIVVGTLAEVARCDMLFLCVSISALQTVLEQIAPFVAPHTVICDTCSVKEYPVQLMKHILPADCGIVGTHPLFGPDSINTNRALPLALCPIRIAPNALRMCKDALSMLPLNIIEISPAEHDRQVAFSQGFTHLIGRIAQKMELHPVTLATLGYKKILDVMEQTCNDSTQLFYDLQRNNRFTLSMLTKMEAALQTITNDLNLTE